MTDDKLDVHRSALALVRAARDGDPETFLALVAGTDPAHRVDLLWAVAGIPGVLLDAVNESYERATGHRLCSPEEMVESLSRHLAGR